MKGVYRAPDQHAVTPQHRGRFPGFDVLGEVHRWDDVTAGAVLHGDEDRGGFIAQGIKQKVQQYLPGTKDGD